MRAAGALVLVALLAGCTGDDGIVTTTPTPTVVAGSEEPGTTPSPTPSGGRELTDEELLALMPEGAGDPTWEGAVSTVLFLLDEYPRALREVDSRVLEALSLPECRFCAGLVDDVVQVDGAGLRLHEGSMTPDFLGLDGFLESEGHARVVFPVRQSDFRYVDSGGVEQRTTNGADFLMYVELRFVDPAWKIAGVEVVAP